MFIKRPSFFSNAKGKLSLRICRVDEVIALKDPQPKAHFTAIIFVLQTLPWRQQIQRKM
jgi:hypothetical protein